MRGANLAYAQMGDGATGCNLQGADLTGAVLAQLVYDRRTRWPANFDPKRHGARRLEPRAELRGWDLDGAHLENQNLEGADLRGGWLRDASLLYAKLRDADLRNAHLQGAYLDRADLRDADLWGASLQNASLGKISHGTTLAGADLRGADLSGVYLTGTRYDSRTRWPAAFDPRQHGAVLANKAGRENLESLGRPPNPPQRCGQRSRKPM